MKELKKTYKTILLLFLITTLSHIVYAQIPVADFTVSSNTTCAGSPITFSDLSNYGGANVVSTNWDFGEGGQSSDPNPTYTYTTAGTYQVLLTVISDGGTDFEIKLDYITVFPNPDVDFSISGNGCSVPFDVDFTNLSSSGAEFSYAWDFGNGETSSLSTPPTITYGADGNYIAQLTVTNTTTNCVTNYSENIVVSNYDAGITAPTGGCLDTPILFSDASTVGANDWVWTTSDGQSSTLQNPEFTFSSVGTYTVSLNSQNTISGCNSTNDVTLEIVDEPVPTFTSDIIGGCSPLNVNFTNTSGDPSATYIWDFGDGSTYTGENPPSQTYNGDGTFNVSLSMTSFGCEGIVSIDSMITVGPPLADFIADTTSGCDPLVIQFTDQSISPDLSNPIISWIWDFGDGTTFNGQNPPPHTYNIGTYDVSLTIQTQNGCGNTINQPQFIEVGAIDLVDFTMLPISACAKTDVTFTNLSVISAAHDPNEVTYLWDFGDGGSDTEENPIYDYPVDTGLFNIDLTVNFRGCEQTESKADQVYILAPIARFTSPNLFCNPSTFPITLNTTDESLSGESTDDITMTWRWGVPGDPDVILNSSQIFDNDNGDTSHVYNSFGTYTIKQVIINNTTGCEDSVETTLYITNVDASFNLSTDSICSGLPLDMTSTSTFSHPDATYEYQMGNGDGVLDNPGQYIYDTPGIYDIDLIVTNSVGCADTTTFPNFLVLENPIANLTASDTAGCAPLDVTFSNQSTTLGNGLSLNSFDWTFPDGSTQTTNDINTTTTFNYNLEGTFTTSILATDEFGCVSPPAELDVSITKPVASNIMDTVVCNQDTVIAVNNATGFGTLTYDWFIDGIFSTNNLDLSYSFNENARPSYDEVMHTIGFKVTDQNGCTDSISKNVHVSLPKADLNYVASGATANNLGEFTCPPVFETFTDSSSTYGNITQWDWDFGDGTSSGFQNPNRTYVFPGTYTLSLSITDEHGCSADTTLIDYLTILGPEGDLDWSVVGDPCERTYNFSATNLLFVDSIVWDLGDGTILYDSTNINHTYAFGTYNATCKLIDSLGCEVTYPLDPIIVDPIVLVANAGPDNQICQDSTRLQAALPQFGTGSWSLISGSASIIYSDSINSPITNLSIGTHVFEWKVVNACDTIADTVEITYTDNTTISFVGPNQYICSDTSRVQGNTPVLGIGNWNLVSGTLTISNPNDTMTTITGINIGTHEIVWSISNFCSSSTDTIVIVRETPPTVPNAGPDDQTCLDTYSLSANPPLVGNGYWSIINGTGILSDSTNPSATLNNISLGFTDLTWTIYNSCDTLIDTLQIERVSESTQAYAGEDQFTCINNSSLEGNEAIVGSGTWNVISNSAIVTDPLDSLSTITNLGVGANELEWSISSFCGVTRDTVIITLETQPDSPVVGQDTIICQNFTTLNATPINVGNGEWSIISGIGTIANNTNPKSPMSNIGLGDNVLQWKVSNSCDADSVLVTISRFEIPTVATAGEDTPICATTYTLEGNTPVFGNGLWTVLSGAGTFVDETNPTTDVSGLNVGENTFQWEISNACGNNPDPVTITVETTPPIATVGPYQTICGGETILEGSSAKNGYGEWTFVSGNGEINTVSDSTSGVTQLEFGENTLRWTITNSCSNSFAEVTILNTGQCEDEYSLNNELIFYVPNSFTPNIIDDLNSVFQPVFTSGYDPLKFSLLIFDRWGELVFESYNADIGWDGTYGTKGRLAQDGVYVWKIGYTDLLTQQEHQVIGHVVLLR